MAQGAAKSEEAAPSPGAATGYAGVFNGVGKPRKAPSAAAARHLANASSVKWSRGAFPTSR